MIKKSDSIILRIKNRINSNNFMEDNRFSKKDFTRKRKLPFTSLMLFMINLVKLTLQKELTNFMRLFSNKKENITKSAFSQSRLKLKHTAFIELNDLIIEEFYTDNDFKTWKGFRLLGIDGSRLALPNSKEILNYFGYLKNQSEMHVPMAEMSTCYDLLNELILSSSIDKFEKGEQDLAIEHLNKVSGNDLFIYDRGYAILWFMYYHINQNKNFIIRLKRKAFKELRDFFESDEESKIITINELGEDSQTQLNQKNIDFKSFKIRLIKVWLKNGEVEVLATSLLDENKYLTKDFKWLYSKRWGIETNFDHLKNHLQLENFTGLSVLSVKQDFFANAFIINMHSIIAGDAQEDIDLNLKNRELHYKINKNLSLGFMKDRIVEILTSNNPQYYNELKSLFKIEPLPVRPDRSFPRNYHRTRRKYYMNKKKGI
jgi:hypothetical protein